MRAITQQDIDLLYQDKDLTTKVELMNADMQIIDDMEGELVSGDFTNDSSSDIRKTISMKFFVKDKKYLMNRSSNIWTDKFAKVSIGMFHFRSKTTVYYPLGIFAFTSTAYTYNAGDNSVTVQCSDQMSFLNGDRNGKIGGKSTKITYGSNIRNSIISTLTQLGNVKNYVVADVASTLSSTEYKLIPYDLEFSTDATVYEVLAKIRDLYSCWEMFFDTEGVFHFQQTPTNLEEPCVLDESVFSTLFIEEQKAEDYKPFYNVIEVFGKDDTIRAIAKEVAIAPTSEQLAADKVYEGCSNITYVVNPDSPFAIQTLGNRTQEKRDVKSSGDYDNITTITLAIARARYELWLSTRFIDTITIQCALIPFLDVNQKVSYTSPITNETNQYITKKITMSLGTGKMTIEMIRFYPEYPFTI